MLFGLAPSSVRRSWDSCSIHRFKLRSVPMPLSHHRHPPRRLPRRWHTVTERPWGQLQSRATAPVKAAVTGRFSSCELWHRSRPCSVGFL